jgi:RNA 2',3'-cyclic 3'-phosphodiesterase
VRAFVAIPLPKECQTMLDRLQRGLHACKAEVRWIAISSIHLTLKFLGEVDPAIVPKLAESLRIVLKSERDLGLRLYGLGSFPNQKSPRVVWCGIHGDTDGLVRLQQNVEAVCADFGFPPEDRPFHPHLTLGRIKGKRNLQPLLDCIKIGSDLECSFKADHFNVYRSILKPQGAVYNVLETIALKG